MNTWPRRWNSNDCKIINVTVATTAGNVSVPFQTNGVNKRIDIQKDPEGPLKLAQVIYDAIGHDNLVKVDNCMTRLRLTVEDNTKIDQQTIKDAGVAGMVLVSKTKGIQIISQKKKKSWHHLILVF
ncbi:PTS transporter subunit EIIB [Spiroplasma endosymbiont of Glossina fuscipes fuscipes]|uniref:PTS transporter subunit EIIB n=1 Tax=Spiroplasma endosymbiont of Glossina fuscipes fuscipes TaxID=2004463 RepID=UPI003CF4A727